MVERIGCLLSSATDNIRVQFLMSFAVFGTSSEYLFHTIFDTTFKKSKWPLTFGALGIRC